MEKATTKLIHIGLPKTGSTALQHYWSNAAMIDCCWQNLTMMVAEVRTILYQLLDYEDLPSYSPFQPDKEKENANLQVFTSEALSTFAWGQRFDAEQVTKARWFFADIMHNNVPDASVLLVVRNPCQWIVSIYKQYIQEGGTQSLQEFVDSEREYLAATLNIKELFDIWSEYYSPEKIILIPYELLRRDTAACNRIVCDKMNLDPDTKVIAQLPEANNSITDKEVAYMRQAAHWLEQLEDHSERSLLTFKNVRKTLLLAIRSELQAKGKLSEYVQETEDAASMTLNLDSGMKDLIQENMLDFLQQTHSGFHGCLSGYQESLRG